MPAPASPGNKISIRLLLCLAALVAAACFGVYRYAGNSLPPGGDASSRGEGDGPSRSPAEANQALVARVRELQEELRLTAQERDQLKEDKAQLLYMVEKLERQSVRTSAAGREDGVNEKVVRSWLVRISELRNAGVIEKAASRDDYVKEVNDVIRGLKEDFADDAFIMGIGYVKTSSRLKSDVSAAQGKLDDIIRYLRAYKHDTD